MANDDNWMRKCTQPAVRRAAKFPELLSHEGKEDEENEQGCYIAYISGIEKLPAKFLRLRLGSNTPTIGELVSKAEAVIGRSVNLSYDGKALPSNLRSYLHRIATSGSVFMENSCSKN